MENRILRKYLHNGIYLGVRQSCLPATDVSPSISVDAGFLLKPDARPLTVEKAYKPISYHS